MNRELAVTQFDQSPIYKEMKVTWLKIMCTVFSISTYYADVVLDILVAAMHYKNGDGMYCGLTIFFIILPGTTMTVFSALWYVTDDTCDRLKVSTTQWVIRIIFLAFLMAPVLRHFEALYFAVRSIKSAGDPQKESYARRMVFENTDAALLRLFEAFLECAPQLILQLYILAQAQYFHVNQFTETDIIQLISIFTSLLAMACSIASYQCTVRESVDYKQDLNCCVCIFPYLWRFFEVTARLVTLGLFTSILSPFLSLLTVVHIMVMFVWLRIIDTDFCDNRPAEFMYNIVLSLMYMFCYIDAKEDPSFKRCIFYYPLIFVENTILISVWYVFYLKESAYKLPVLVMMFVCFTLAILTMIFYYTLLHPTRGKLLGTHRPNDANDRLSRLRNSEFALREEMMDIRGGDRDDPTPTSSKFFVNAAPSEMRTEL